MELKNRKGLKVIVGDDPRYISARLYDTKIFIQTGDKVTINRGAFKTNHTKTCINDLLPWGYKVAQRKGKWFIDYDQERKESIEMVHPAFTWIIGKSLAEGSGHCGTSHHLS